jgi:hypothetical protein
LGQEKTDIEILSACRRCGNIEYRDKWETGKASFVFNIDTWNKADIFSTNTTLVKFCTSKVVQCALVNKHTGARFFPAGDLMIGDKKYIKRIDELK